MNKMPAITVGADTASQDFGCSSEEWVTKCIRSLTDNEKPLVLQSDWSVQVS